LSSRLLSKNFKKIYTFPVVLCGRETYSLTLREEHALRVIFEVFTAAKIHLQVEDGGSMVL
jgi:hypothetical protein